MKRSVLVLLVFITLSVTVNAQQEPFLQWQRSLGGSGDDEAYSIDTTTDGGYIIAGASTSTNDDVSGNHGDYDYWIVKLDASHNTEWAKTYGGSGLDIAKSIKQTKDGGFIIAGYSNSKDGDVTGNHGGIDMWILKLDAGGNIIWQKSLGGSYYDYAYSVDQTTDSGYIISGASASKDGDLTKNNGDDDFWIVKIDNDGNLQWQKTYGGKSGDYAYSVQQTNDGGYIVGGTSHSNDHDILHNHGGNDYCVLKLDAAGNLQWQNSYGGKGQELLNDIQPTKDGDYIIAGSAQFSDGQVTGYHGNHFNGPADAWIVKINSTGKIIWEKAVGNTGYDYAFSIKQTATGGYIFTGYDSQNGGKITNTHGETDLWVVELDSNGNFVWQKSLGGYSSQEGNSIQLTNDGGYVVAGNSQGGGGNVSYSHGSGDYWIVKLSPENLPHNIAVTDYDSMSKCSGDNYITYQVKDSLPVTVNLYWSGNLYKTKDSIKQYVTFNNLSPGQYFATITRDRTLLSTSKLINIVSLPKDLKISKLSSVYVHFSWKPLSCANSYSLEYKQIDSLEWKIRKVYVPYYYISDLAPSTTYIVRLGASINENGINATGKRYDSLTFTTLAASGDAATAVKLNVLSNNVTILPNPANSYFIINYNSVTNKKASAVLYDINGKAVWTSGLVSADAFISKKVITSQLPNGVYYLKLMDDAGTSINTKKIIIAR